jgi:hypothetical protein
VTDNENLPAKSASRDVAATTEQSGGLVTRGLAAIRSEKSLQPIDKTDPEELFADAVLAGKRKETAEAIRLALQAANQGHAKSLEFLVKLRTYQCWNAPPGARAVAEFRVAMNPDTTVHTVELLNTERYGEPSFRAVADSARRALLNPMCSPLILPRDQYHLWQTFTITFDPSEIEFYSSMGPANHESDFAS